MRKLSQAALDPAPASVKYVNRKEHMQDNLKNTLYRVVIRDKEYWSQVEDAGGLQQSEA